MSFYFPKWTDPNWGGCELKYCVSNEDGFLRNGYLVDENCNIGNVGYPAGAIIQKDNRDGVSVVYKSLVDGNRDNPELGSKKTPPTWEVLSLIGGGAGGTDTFDMFGKTYQGSLPKPADATVVAKNADGTTTAHKVAIARLENTTDPVNWPNGIWVPVTDLSGWILEQEA